MQSHERFCRPADAREVSIAIWTGILNRLAFRGLSVTHNTFGTHLADGPLRLLEQYVITNRCYGDGEYLEWCRCPHEISAANARLPALNADTQLYPAVFLLWDSFVDAANMACEAILLQGSLPRRSRVRILMAVVKAREQISHLGARPQN